VRIDGATVTAMQRSAGNAATAALLTRLGARPAEARLHRQHAPDTDTSTASARPTTGTPGADGPELKQGPIGEVVVPIGPWEIYSGSIDKRVTKALVDKTTFLVIPIPGLGVRVAISGHADMDAGFHASFTPRLENIQIGLSRRQAEELLIAAGLLVALLPGIAPELLVALAAFGSPATLAPLSAAVGEFRGIADLVAPVSVHLDAKVSAGLDAEAAVAGAFSVAEVGAGFNAGVGADWAFPVRDRMGLYFTAGRLDFHNDAALEASFGLHGHLSAYITASLLGCRWRKDWTLGQLDLARQWHAGAALDLNNAASAPATFSLNEEELDLAGLVTQLLTKAVGPQNVTPLSPGGGGAGGGGAVPTGRSQSDPIPMTWFKSPGHYPISVELQDGRYVFTEPDWVPVPKPEPGLPDPLRDVRRNAQTDEHGRDVIRIGVSPGSDYYPKIGAVWPRVKVGAVRGGVKQRQFRRLLEAQGFSWGPYEADHVRDLQWAGRDEYENLWPLEEAANNAANDILGQLVTYRDATGAAHAVPLRDTPLNLYFRIDQMV
jgi:hypothetical protein